MESKYASKRRGLSWLRVPEQQDDTLQLDSIERALKQDSENGDHWNDMGEIYLAMLRYDQALSDFEQAPQLDLTLAAIWHHKIETLRALRRQTEA